MPVPMRTIYNKVLMTLLKVLGFSAPLAFMACYGPPPSAGINSPDADQEWIVEDSTAIDEVEINDSIIQQQQ